MIRIFRLILLASSLIDLIIDGKVMIENNFFYIMTYYLVNLSSLVLLENSFLEREMVVFSLTLIYRALLSVSRCNRQTCTDDLCLTAKTGLRLTVLVTADPAFSVLFCLFYYKRRLPMACIYRRSRLTTVRSDLVR